MLRLLLRLFRCSTPPVSPPSRCSPGFASIIHPRILVVGVSVWIRDVIVARHTRAVPDFSLEYRSIRSRDDCSGLLLYFERSRGCARNKYFTARAGTIRARCRPNKWKYRVSCTSRIVSPSIYKLS